MSEGYDNLNRLLEPFERGVPTNYSGMSKNGRAIQYNVVLVTKPTKPNDELKIIKREIVPTSPNINQVFAHQMRTSP